MIYENKVCVYICHYLKQMYFQLPHITGQYSGATISQDSNESVEENNKVPVNESVSIVTSVYLKW